MRHIAKSFLVRSGLPRVTRTFNRGRGLILMYHGLTADRVSREWNQVTLNAFENQMAFLRRRYAVLPLDEMVEGLAAGRLPPHAASITFDDGYRSVFDLARPVLARYGLPATVYVVTDFVGSERHRYLWTDQVTILLSSAPDGEIDLSWAGLERYAVGDPGRIMVARREINHRLKSLPDTRRREILERWSEAHGPGIDHDRFKVYQPMTWDEVKTLESEGLIRVGAHTRSHPILSRTAASLLREEIVGSQEDIAVHLGCRPRHFAYPNGRSIDFTPDAVEIVRAEFASATTTIRGFNRARTNPYLLRRVGVGGPLSPAEFAGLMSGMFFPGKTTNANK